MRKEAILSGPEQPTLSGEKAKQLVVLLHGLGANGEDLISLADMFARDLPDAHFIAPDAPFPCDMAPFGYQWFSLLNRDEASILSGIRQVLPILQAFLNAQLERFQLEMAQLMLIGFSQGTMLSLHTALRGKTPMAGVLGYSGALIGESVLLAEIQSRPPVCLVHGTFDSVVPFAAMGKAEEVLVSAGVPVESHARPGIGHGIDPQGIDIGRRFLQKCLLNEKTTLA